MRSRSRAAPPAAPPVVPLPRVSPAPSAPATPGRVPPAGADKSGWRTCMHVLFYRMMWGLNSRTVGRLQHGFQRSSYGALRPLPTHASQPVTGDFEVGTKRKFALPTGERLSVVTAADGSHYAMSQTRTFGGYGKLRLALGFDDKLYAVKELRLAAREKGETQPAPGAPRLHTKVSSPLTILREISTMAAASGQMRVHRSLELSGNVLLFLPLMADNASALPAATPAFAYKIVGRQILTRACADLAAIHARGYLHHDVKLDNILWGAGGDAVFSDFGSSCPVDPQSGTARTLGNTAGNMPLEFELGAPSSWGLDTFMLGLAMADFYAPHLRSATFHGPAVADLQALEAWRQSVLDPGGHVDVARVGHVPHLPASEAGWDAYFAQVCMADPQVGAFIIERMLNRDVAARATLAQVRAFVVALQPPEGPAARAAQSMMRAIANNDWDRQRSLRHLRHFKKRMQQQMSAKG